MSTHQPDAPEVELRDEVAKCLHSRLRDRMTGRRGRRIMPSWKDTFPEERAPFLEDAAAVIHLIQVRERQSS